MSEVNVELTLGSEVAVTVQPNVINAEFILGQTVEVEIQSGQIINVDLVVGQPIDVELTLGGPPGPQGPPGTGTEFITEGTDGILLIRMEDANGTLRDYSVDTTGHWQWDAVGQQYDFMITQDGDSFITQDGNELITQGV